VDVVTSFILVPELVGVRGCHDDSEDHHETGDGREFEEHGLPVLVLQGKVEEKDGQKKNQRHDNKAFNASTTCLDPSTSSFMCLALHGVHWQTLSRRFLGTI